MQTETTIPLISIIVPTFQRNDMLATCLNPLSPEVQKVASERYEVIVTDDGRTSTAEEMVRTKYPYARWIKGPQKGPASNRNNGASSAKGQWVAFIDDDCVPDAAFVSGYLLAIEARVNAYEGKITCVEGITSPLYGSPTNLKGGCFWSANIMVNREFFERFGGFNTDFPNAINEDVDMRERLKAQGETIKFVPEAIVNHPPRLRNMGVRQGKMRESEVLMWYLCGKHQSFRPVLVKRIITEAVRRIRRYPVTGDSLKVLSEMSAELMYVLRNIGAWEAKYRELYHGKKPPYPYPY